MVLETNDYTLFTFDYFQSVLGILMIIPGDIGTLIDFFGFTSSIFYCASMVALIVMRFTKKNEHRPIKVGYHLHKSESSSSFTTNNFIFRYPLSFQ